MCPPNTLSNVRATRLLLQFGSQCVCDILAALISAFALQGFSITVAIVKLDTWLTCAQAIQDIRPLEAAQFQVLLNQLLQASALCAALQASAILLKRLRYSIAITTAAAAVIRASANAASHCSSPSS